MAPPEVFNVVAVVTPSNGNEARVDSRWQDF